jgi:hypothetical protein
MKNVLIGIFSIPVAILVGSGFLVLAQSTAYKANYGGTISLLPATLIVLGLACVSLNVFAINERPHL